MALPLARAVTFPVSGSTEATSVSFESQATVGFVASAGRTVLVSVIESPAFMVCDWGVTVMLVISVASESASMTSTAQ